MRKYLYTLIGALLVLTACNNDPIEAEQQQAELKVSSTSPYVTINQDGLSGNVEFRPFGGEAEIKVETDQRTFTVDDPELGWLEVTQVGDRVKLKAEDIGEGEQRTATVTVTAGEGKLARTATLSISQEKYGEVYIKLTPSKVLIDPTGKVSETVTVETNAATWTHDLNSTWLGAEIRMQESKLILSADPNPDAETRKVEITITATTADGSQTETLYVEQGVQSELSVSSELASFDSSGGNQTITVTTNQEDYSLGALSVDWATASKNGNEITINVLKNEKTTTRSTSLVVFAGSGNNISTKLITISQLGNDPNVMILELTIPMDGSLAILPLYDEVKATVNWGDGSSDNYSGVITEGEAAARHTYATAGVYDVAISGEVARLDVIPMGNAREYLTAVKQWGKTGLEVMEGAFESCQNLKSIPGDTHGSFASVVTFADAFSMCRSLETIPADLFKYAGECENFKGVFYDGLAAEGNIKAIPEGLFDNCTKAISFESAFFGQAKITSLPENLFANNPNARIFTEAFRQTGITSIPENLFAGNSAATMMDYAFINTPIASIPENLFKNNTAVTTFKFTFGRCTNLSSVPGDLFKYNVNATNFSSTFAWCSDLTAIPAGLLDNTAVNDMQSMFYECTSLTTIPEGAFENLTGLTQASGIFVGCTALTTIPERLFNAPLITDANRIFAECPALTTIPSDLFAGFSGLKSITSVFENCTSLAVLPSKLFANMPSTCTTFTQVFLGCTSLTTVPEDLFENSPSILTLQHLFSGCTSLQTVPAGLFAPCTAMTNITGLFFQCTGLKTVPSNIFDSNRALNTYSLAFADCSALTSESPYTMVSGNKVHLYQRNASNGFAATQAYISCFRGCTKMVDWVAAASAANGMWVD